MVLISFEGEELITQALKNIVSDKKVIEKASLRALNKTAGWLKTHAARDIATQAKVPVRLIKNRLSVIRANKLESIAKLTAKTCSIKPHHIGVLKQTKKGASVGKHKFQGAFIATMPKVDGSSIYKRKGKTRLPVKQMKISISEPSESAIDKLIEKHLNERFEQLFTQELNYIKRK